MLKSHKIMSTGKKTIKKNDVSSSDLSNILDDIYKNEKTVNDISIIEKVRNPKVLKEKLGTELKDQDTGGSITDNLSIKSNIFTINSGGNFIRDKESFRERDKTRKTSFIEKDNSESVRNSDAAQFSFFNEFEFKK